MTRESESFISCEVSSFDAASDIAFSRAELIWFAPLESSVVPDFNCSRPAGSWLAPAFICSDAAASWFIPPFNWSRPCNCPAIPLKPLSALSLLPTFFVDTPILFALSPILPAVWPKFAAAPCNISIASWAAGSWLGLKTAIALWISPADAPIDCAFPPISLAFAPIFWRSPSTLISPRPDRSGTFIAWTFPFKAWKLVLNSLSPAASLFAPSYVWAAPASSFWAPAESCPIPDFNSANFFKASSFSWSTLLNLLEPSLSCEVASFNFPRPSSSSTEPSWSFLAPSFISPVFSFILPTAEV